MHVRDLYIGDLMYHCYGGVCCPQLQFQYSLQQYVGFVMCGYFDNCVHVGNMCTSIYCTLCCLYCVLYCFIYVYFYLSLL